MYYNCLRTIIIKELIQGNIMFYKISYKFILIGLFFILCSVSQPAFAIKIGLNDGISESYVATSSAGTLVDGQTNNPIIKLQGMKKYTLKTNPNGIAIKINGQFYNLGTNSISVCPSANGFVSTKNKWYRGKLIVNQRDNGLTVINELTLEDYIKGVVPAEMPSSWSIEAHKAQAIAARSYALANRGKRGAHGYDLKDTPEDQAYGGASRETQRTNTAVTSTKGVVLTYDNKIIPAYYCASSGGHTVDAGSVWYQNLPYIKGVPSFDDNISKNGHGVGMSQWGANNLAKQGYNAYQILDYFYNNIRFAKLRYDI